MTTISQQDKCINRMLDPRTSERRAVKNRRAAVRAFRRYAEAKGYTQAEVTQMVIDIWDMYHLELNAEESS